MSSANRVCECPHCHERQAFGQIHTPACTFDSREWFQVKCHACGGVGPRRQTLQEASDAFLTLRVAGPGEVVVRVEDLSEIVGAFEAVWNDHVEDRASYGISPDALISRLTAAIDAAS